ncbi:hypothetical protein AB0M39_16855 [Streptomyces sp. NPDC051907]|uniref:hypothetical protein n=1 Tax=Streptomyces sp. NPDC051907 TaxID=3155284 RepID=UPI00342B2B68
MSNRQEDTRVGATHEPHEVTVELDGLGLKLAELHTGPTDGRSPAEPSDGPVFVDESGRRSKKFRRIGWLLVVACACYAATLVVALIGGNSSAPWQPGFGGSKEEKTERVEIQPAPTDDPPSSVGTPGGDAPQAPSPEQSVGAVLPQPSDGPSAVPGASAGPGATGSASPKPSGGAVTKPKPTPPTPSPGGGGSDPGPGPAEPSPSVSPPSDPGPSDLPTEPAA